MANEENHESAAANKMEPEESNAELSKPNHPGSTILVAGDITSDFNLFRLPAAQSQYTEWNDADLAHVCPQPGGAQLLGGLIANTSTQLATNCYPTVEVITPERHAMDETVGHSYVVWAPFPATRDQKCKDRIWRVEKFLGINRPERPAKATEPTGDACTPTVLVLNDTNLGFNQAEGQWPACLREGPPPRWIVLKTSRLELLENGKASPLWKHLQEHHAERLVIHVTADSLRECQIQISRGISWERTAQDLLWELRFRLFGQPLLAKHTTWHCAYAIVSLNAAGAFLFSPHGEIPNAGKATLIYSPKSMEGEWEKTIPGKVIGSASCFSAALALALAASPDQPEMIQALKAALRGVRALHRQGYGPLPKSPKLEHLEFPYLKVAEAIADGWTNAAPDSPEDVFHEADLPEVSHPVSTRSACSMGWSLLHGDLHEIATQVVLRGTDSPLEGAPMAVFGALETVDRREIEGFRGIRNLLGEYINKHENRPVSIAVFGPPGSGKSFGVKEIARGLTTDIETKTFNLSQFGSPTELVAAFHQVRDAGLSGKLPLVFWDEFDSSLDNVEFGWLRYFLEPMQDGTFLEGQVSHPIGRAIFVFAGGTRATFEKFSQPENETELGKFKNIKGPDFVSRLRGFLNILGPNPLNCCPESDPCHVVRRAILLRSMLKRGYPALLNGGTLQIDEGVLSAFIRVGTYRHGARSMESLLAASTLAGKTFFGRSCLPPFAQLNLHVDGTEFQSIVEEMDGLENLAQTLHVNYYEKLESRGYHYGTPSDEANKISDSLLPYDQLPEELKRQNIHSARELPAKLAAVGYAILPAREGTPPVEFPPEVLERLAELEHDRWLRMKLRDGWMYGTPRDNNKKHHPAILPWRDITPDERAKSYPEGPERVGLTALPDHEKDKDRDQFIGLSAMLGRYGCTVVKLASRITVPPCRGGASAP